MILSSKVGQPNPLLVQAQVPNDGWTSRLRNRGVGGGCRATAGCEDGRGEAGAPIELPGVIETQRLPQARHWGWRLRRRFPARADKTILGVARERLPELQGIEGAPERIAEVLLTPARR